MTHSLDQMSYEELGILFPIILSDPNDEWKNIFNSEKLKIEKIFEPEVIRIEHIGSTAIPYLKAKPTIDILMEVSESIENESVIKYLNKIGYHYISRPEDPAPHMMFVKGYTLSGFKGQTFHIHVRYFGNWDEIYFRDYLIKFPKIAQEYSNLKIRLANEFKNNRESYTDGKTKFIKKINQIARKEFKNLCPTCR